MNKKNLKLLLSFYRPYRGLFAADLICSLAAAGIALAALVAVQALCTYFYDYQGHYLGAKIERDMRSRMFCQCQRLPFSYYDSHTVGDLMSRISNDTLSLAEFFHHVPEDLLINSVKLAGAA